MKVKMLLLIILSKIKLNFDRSKTSKVNNII